jgi:hypothetical protein
MVSVRRRTAGELARERKEGSRRKEGQPEEGGAVVERGTAEEHGAAEDQSGGQPAEEQSRSAGVAAGS